MIHKNISFRLKWLGFLFIPRGHKTAPFRARIGFGRLGIPPKEPLEAFPPKADPPLAEARVGSIFMGGFLGSVAAQQLSLDETIDALIVLFEARDYRAVVTQYSYPDAIAEQETEGVGREEAINKLVALQEQFGGMTLKRLKEAKGMQPRCLNDGQDALFDFKGGYFCVLEKIFMENGVYYKIKYLNMG